MSYYPEYEIATPMEGTEGVLRFSVPNRRPVGGQTVLICNLHLSPEVRASLTVAVNGVVVYRSSDASWRASVLAAFPEELLAADGENIIEVALEGARPERISDVLVLYNVPKSLVGTH